MELDADDMEPTRGDEPLDEYVWEEWGKDARGGSLSLPYSGRGKS